MVAPVPAPRQKLPPESSDPTPPDRALKEVIPTPVLAKSPPTASKAEPPSEPNAPLAKPFL